MWKYILALSFLVLQTQASHFNIQDFQLSSHNHLRRFHYHQSQPANDGVVVSLNKKIKVIGMNENLPEGWRILKLREGKFIKESLKPLLNRWSIVAFDKGKMDGWGYGGKIHDTYGPEAGQRFIVHDQ